MTIVGIDPGTTESAYVVLAGGVPIHWGIVENDDLLNSIRRLGISDQMTFVIEMIASYGMAVGKETFETVYWIGRFVEQLGSRYCERVFRRDIKKHLCGATNAKDTNVKQALIDHYGGDSNAVGGDRCKVCSGRGKTKGVACDRCAGTGYRNPKGPLYGIKSHCWAALAVAVYYEAQQAKDAA